MTDDARFSQIETRLDGLERGAGVPGEQCTATNPHDGMMYDRIQYTCRCGKVYLKNGRGGLREE